MKYIHMQKINIRKLIKKEYKKKLYINKKTRSRDNLVWQQMTCENFCRFLEDKALYFKNLSLYSDEEERKLRFYKECYLGENEEKNKLIKRLYSDFEQIVYISCWFDLNWLTKLVFNAYAGDFGIAIGIDKDKLVDAIELAMQKKYKNNEEIFYGNVAYIGDDCELMVDSEEAVAPLFLKRKLFSPDNEFRLAYIKDSLWKRDLKGLSLPEEIPPGISMGIGNVVDFVEYIAVKDCEKTFEAICEKHGLKKRKADLQMDGFSVYKIERMNRRALYRRHKDNSRCRNRRLKTLGRKAIKAYVRS